jgi:YD repeat-containing protein
MPHPVPSRCTPWLPALALALGALFLTPVGAQAQCITPPGQQQTTACTDAEAPSGSLLPSTGGLVQAAVPVVISWMDESPTSLAWVRWNGADVTPSFAVRTWRAPVPDADLGEHGRATGSVVITAGQPNTIEARVCDQAVQGSAGGRCSTWTATYSVAPPPGVEVTPESGFVSVVASGSAAAQAFTVRNTGGSTATFALTAACRDAADTLALATCSLSNSSVPVAAGATQTVTLSYSRPTAGRVLLLQVRAAQTGTPGVHDVGWVDVTVEGVGTSWLAPVVSVVDLNSGTQIERSQCVTVSAGAGAAYECGDLRLAHALPTVITKGKARTPVLLYNSQHAHPRPTVYADVALPPTALPPEWVQAVVTVNGVPYSRTFAGAEWRPGTTRRIAVQWDGSAMQTGVYGYTLQVTSHYGGGPAPAAPVSGELAVVNRRPEWPGPGIGPGWGVAGVEQLVWLPGRTRALRVSGDGGTRLYQSTGAGVLVAPSVSRPDTLRLMTVQGQTHAYRRLPGGARVWYDSVGRHVRTVNAIGDTTHFAYDSAGRLLQIRVPRPDGGTASYDFAGRDALGRLHWIALALNGAHARLTVLDFYGTDAAVDLIYDPDGKYVRLEYADAQNPYRVTLRRSRGGAGRVGFGYDASGKLAWSRTYMDTTAAHGDIVAGFEAVESRGVAHAPNTTFTSVGASQVYTRLDGPRADVADHTWLWVGRWGAPARIRDAMGGETVITRGDLRFPALATEVVGPSGFRSVVAYDSGGRVVQSTEVNPLGDGVNRTVAYTWDERWDRPDTIRAPGVGETRMAYDSITGNVLWQEVGAASRRTWFDYHGAGSPLAGLLARVRYPHPVTGAAGGGGSDSLAYDAMGNLRMTRSPLGFLTVHVRDALGRDTLTVTPIDTTHARSEGLLLLHGARQRTEYDAMDRPWRMTTLGPAMIHGAGAEGWVPKPSAAEQLVVTTTYNDIGQPLAILRESSPYESEQFTAYAYDGAGRKVMEQTGTVTQRFAYDPAGNVVTATTGRGHQITTQHDALGRPTRRTVPSVTAAAQCVPLPGMFGCRQFPLRPNNGSGYMIPEETSVFRYDQAGRMVYAENRDAIVRRGYHPGGALRTDSLWLRTYDGLSFD